MKEFRYQALTAAGQTVTGIRRARSPEELAADLLASGLVLLRSRRVAAAWLGFLLPQTKIKHRDLADFTQHMATSISAGIPAVTALQDFEGQTTGRLDEVVADIHRDVSSGTGLDEAFSRHPQVFSPVYRAMLTAGQSSGNLDEAFAEMVDYLEWNESLRSQTSQAMIYPAILLTGIFGLFLLLMLFVIPRFEGIFASVDFELPTLTVKALALGRFMGHWWWLMGVSVAALAAGWHLSMTTRGGRYQRDRWLLKAPVVGPFMMKIALSRFGKTFSLIYASGVDLLRTLDLMRGVVGNAVLAGALRNIRTHVAAGESLTESFRRETIFPPLIQRLITVGESTGSLDRSLIKASQHLDREIPRDLKKAFTIFEALVIAALGVLVCLAALSLLMPIMQIKVT